MADEPKTAMEEAMQNAGVKTDSTPNPQYQSEGGELARRKPGRPPKTTAGVDNANTNYRPSVERNNVDQSLQPTGDGDVAGDAVGEMPDGSDDADNQKLFPVRLKRNYHPLAAWKTVRDDGSYGPKPRFEDGETPKVKAGYAIALPIEEAKAIIAKGIAERADEIK